MAIMHKMTFFFTFLIVGGSPNKLWSNGAVVKALDSETRCPVFKTTGKFWELSG